MAILVGFRSSLSKRLMFLQFYHNANIADAFEGVVNPSICQLHQHFLNGLAVVLWVHKLSGSELLGSFKLVWVDVNANDPGGTN